VVGLPDGEALGEFDGLVDGLALGEVDGLTVGEAEGEAEGLLLGDTDGEAEGLLLGEADGLLDGLTLGEVVGFAVGETLGELLGLLVGDVLGDVDGDMVLQFGFSSNTSIRIVSPHVLPSVLWAMSELLLSRSFITAPLSLQVQFPFAESALGSPPQYRLVMITSFT
jgi:hypothetical protein